MDCGLLPCCLGKVATEVTGPCMCQAPRPQGAHFEFPRPATSSSGSCCSGQTHEGWLTLQYIGLRSRYPSLVAVHSELWRAYLHESHGARWLECCLPGCGICAVFAFVVCAPRENLAYWLFACRLSDSRLMGYLLFAYQ